MFFSKCVTINATKSFHITANYSTRKMKINRIISQLSLIFLLIIANETGKKTYRFAEGAKRRIQITDDLDDVVDDEEDESWKEWGKKKKSGSKSTSPEFDPPPEDFSKMDPSQMQAEMLKRQFGPVFGFVKLRLGSRRTPVRKLSCKISLISLLIIHSLGSFGYIHIYIYV